MMRCLIYFGILLTGIVLPQANGQETEGCFVATGGIRGDSGEIEQGVISISEDGREWKRVFDGGLVKEHFTHGNDNMVRALTYGKGRFVAAGNRFARSS